MYQPSTLRVLYLNLNVLQTGSHTPLSEARYLLATANPSITLLELKLHLSYLPLVGMTSTVLWVEEVSGTSSGVWRRERWQQVKISLNLYILRMFTSLPNIIYGPALRRGAI
jgi:hypothetical protein